MKHHALYAWIDVVLLMLFLALFMAALAKIQEVNPVQTQNDQRNGLIVAVSWPQGDTDVDLWLDGPGETRPVGYSNKSGLLWSLIRDDLGTIADSFPANYEDAVTRGVVAGDYTANLHCYRCPVLPVLVSIEITLRVNQGADIVRVWAGQVTLYKDGQEITALHFHMDDAGRISNIDSVFRPLRSRGIGLS